LARFDLGARPVPLEAVGKLHSEICALPDLALGVVVLVDSQARFFECSQQAVQIFRQKLLTKGRIDSCPLKLVFGDRVAHCLRL
jgi:hypothetical protein